MGMLSNNQSMADPMAGLAKMLGRMGPGGLGGFMGQQQSGPGHTGPAQSSVAPGMSPSTGNPATYWWNQPGAGTGAVTQAPPLNNSALARLMNFGGY